MQSKDYHELSLKGWWGAVNQSVPVQEIENIISDNGDLNQEPALLHPVKIDRKVKVFLSSLTFNSQSTRVYIKQFLFHSLFALMKYDLGKSRARSAFDASLMLEQYGIKAPKPLALLEKYTGPVARSSILITQEVPEAVQLSEKLKQLSQDGSVEALRKKHCLIKEFGRSVGQMHEQGILHGDLRLRNVLVQDNEESFRFWLIDNERTKLLSRLVPRHVRKNLVQLNKWRVASNTDRLRFVNAYAENRGLSKNEARILVEKIYKRIGVRRKIKALKKIFKGNNKRARQA